MYNKGSSFETNLTLQTRSNTFRDASFSSFLNKAEENMIRKLSNQASKLSNDHRYHVKSEDDEEIDVFGAEKYFKEEIEDGGNKNDLRFIDASDTTRKMHQQDQKVKDFEHNFSVKRKDDQRSMQTPSVRSNASCNSRSGLLCRTVKSPEKLENGSKTKIRAFFGSFGCNCMNKKSTQIKDKRFILAKQNSNTRMFDFDPKTDQFSSKFADTTTRNDYFSFPVLNSDNSNDPNSNLSSNSKPGNLAGKIVKVDNNSERLSLGKKLSLLNNLEEEMYNSSSRRYNNDVESDSSSDLFEIESFSPTGDSSYLGHRRLESNCYAPSEVSIEWSVVTASAANFSVVSDYEDVRTGDGGRRNSGGNGEGVDNIEEKKKRPGILSGCASHKAVRVAGDEYKVTGAGGGAGGRWWLSDSTMVGSMFRGGTI